jgi:formylglycine-generating enzyme
VKPSHAFVLAFAGSAVACGGASELRPEPSGTTHAVVAAATPGGVGDDKARVGDAADKMVEGLISSTSSRCPTGMVDVEGRFCIDRFEASVLEILPNGDERPWSPYFPVDGKKVRAVSEPGVHPQGYISAVQAGRACAESGKRLCKADEWRMACRGPQKKAYGYSEQREVGRCNDNGKNGVMALFGPNYTSATMNRAELNQLQGTLAKTGEHEGCTNGYGVYDMVGNLHEWVADGHAFQGGYYQDVASVGHGEGCGYVTTAHEARYHDYSTGFRCCSDPPGIVSAAPAPKKRPSFVAPRKKRLNR